MSWKIPSTLLSSNKTWLLGEKKINSLSSASNPNSNLYTAAGSWALLFYVFFLNYNLIIVSTASLPLSSNEVWQIELYLGSISNRILQCGLMLKKQNKPPPKSLQFKRKNLYIWNNLNINCITETWFQSHWMKLIKVQYHSALRQSRTVLL